MSKTMNCIVLRREADRLKFKELKESGANYYCEDDIKQNLLAIAHVNTQLCFHDWLKDIAKIVSRKCGREKAFFDIDGKLYFSEIGYRKILDYLKEHEIIRPERCR